MTHIHLIGIGGAGMSVIADLLHAEGWTVTGSDARASATTERLADSGITLWIGTEPERLSADTLVAVSSAIREDNPELARARQLGARVIHRSQALALASGDRDFVAVAGAHGKTTTSAMLAVALEEAGQAPSWAIGGSVRGHGSGGHLGTGKVLVAEADESDASFLNYRPRIALVTNVEPDHLDHYGSREAFEEAFAEFARCIVPGGLLIVCGDDAGAHRLGAQAVSEGIRVVSYGRGAPLPGAESHVALEDSALRCGESRAPLSLQVPGSHNELNAAGAAAAGIELGVSLADMARGLAAFTGTGRRFELRGEAGGVRLFDDYAHHPTEVEATLRAARAEAGQGSVRVLFQPHLYSRTRNFADRFATALELADTAIVTAVYGARETPVDGIEGDMITSRMGKAGYFIADKHEAARALAASAKPGDLLLTMGAGDVTALGPEILAALEEGTAR